MRKLAFTVLMTLATTAAAQQLDLKVLDKVAAKAKSTTEMGMDGATIQSTARALDDKKKDESAVKSALAAVKGFFLRSYEFEQGQFKLDDIKPLTDQLKAPNWIRFLRNKEADEQTEIWWHVTNGETDGMLLIAAESNELTVINAIGVADLSALGMLKNLGGVGDLVKQ